MRLSLKTVLADERYPVRAIESAEEALSLLEREEFFMVITDARLGGMSGYEFLGKARAQWPELPILMITAYATPKLAVEAIKAGAIDYLAKPFAPEELLHAVARCAERYRLLRENASLRAQRDRDLAARADHRRLPQDARAAPTHSDRRPHRRPGAGSRRERHWQGVGGWRLAHSESALPGRLRANQLRRHPRGASGVRALRTRKGGVHRSAETETWPRGRSRWRHYFPGRDRRHEPAAAGQAAPVPGGRHVHARGRHRRNCRSMSGSSPPPIAISSRPFARASSGRTCFTGSTWCSSACRRCASAART